MKIFASLFCAVLIGGCITVSKNDSPSPNASASINTMEDILPAVYYPQPPKQNSQLFGGFCCDGNGWRRCILDAARPLGAPCFCYGQGYGTVCM